MQLEEYLKINSSTVYYPVYENVKQATREIWKEPRLGWYTDHGVEHSMRVVSILDQICSDLLIEQGAMKDGLRPEEVFLLLSAAWLHDIGMQDLSDLNDKPIDQQTESEWEQVRKRHPEQTRLIIAASAPGSDQPNPFSVGLETDLSVHIPLALICQGHGSNYYEDVVKTLDKRTFVFDGKTEKIRGALLTSLLLLADELDLHHRRAVFKRNFPLSKVSRMHYFRHHFVQDVRISNLTKVKKQIKITLAIPESEQGNGWVEDLQGWLKRKLKYELARTYQPIEIGLNGSLCWADVPIVFKVEPAELTEKKLPDNDIRDMLRWQNNHVIDWKLITAEIRSRFVKRTGGAILLNGSIERGNNRFFSFLSSMLNGLKDGQKPVQCILHLNFTKGDSYGSLYSIIVELGRRLSLADADFFDCTEIPLEKLEHLAVKIKEKKIFCLIVLQNYDYAFPQAWKELSAVLTRASSAVHDNLFFLVNTAETTLAKDIISFDLPDKFTEQDMLRYFNKLGYYGKKAEEIASRLNKIQESTDFNTSQIIILATELSDLP